MAVKRLRILAGPNGSGKTSVYTQLKKDKSFNWGVFVNADDIEEKLKNNGYLDIQTFGVKNFNWEEFRNEYEPFVASKEGKCPVENLRFIDEKLFVLKTELVDSYLACFVAESIRQELLTSSGVSVFTTETVMSHPSKLELMKQAKAHGYRVYLYYVTTQSPEINIGRVATRVKQGGHDVKSEKVIARYTRSLGNLLEAIRLSNRAYLFDNSGTNYVWIAEYDGDTGQLQVRTDMIPKWFKQYVLQRE